MKGLLHKLVREGVLKKTNPSDNVCKSYIEKSRSNLAAAKLLVENKMLEEATSLIYYSMYNLVLALLYRVGLKSENYSASIYLLGEVFEIEIESIKEAKKERIDKQYYTGFEIAKEDLDAGIIMAEDFNRELNGFILGLNAETIEEYKSKIGEILQW